MKKETILLYAPEGSTKVQKMKPAMIRLGVRVKLIQKEMFTSTIGELLGMSEEEIKEVSSQAQTAMPNGGHDIIDSNEIPEMNEEVFVMYNFSNQKVDQLLQNFRKAGVPKVALKAIVTPNNITWTFGQLAAELVKEHEAYLAQ